ncbi:MAG: AAA family ATPase [Desulfitobacteriia bacterium]|jgi:predicted ATPase/signal transduction histidine kinase/DNA-binding NarL/FixJ family response regulator
MSSVKGYLRNEKLFEDHTKVIYKGLRERDGQAVLLKLPGRNTLPLKALQSYEKELAVSKKIDANCILKVVELIQQDGIPILVTEYFEGKYLYSLPEGQALDPKTFLDLALNLAQALVVLYENSLIYNNLNPSGLMFNSEGLIKLADFSKAFYYGEDPGSEEEQSLANLQFISPEGTGRLPSKVDFRSDLYSLGLLFYRLLSGKPAFQAEDSLEIVHAHLAKKPPSLLTSKPKVPPILAEIVEKLLEKKQEDRYQSAWGLQADLEKCLSLLQSAQGVYEIKNFKIAENDIFEDFRLSGRLYNREEELAQLKTNYRHIRNGSAQLILISGSPGTGKTSLAAKFLEQAWEDGALCVSGKFDQYNKDLPYTAFAQALDPIIGKILTESEQVIESWRQKIVKALTPNVQLIVQIIPELERIVGLQPEIAAGSPLETQNRLDQAFLSFIQLFATKETPLVLFLDDLQWADSPSIRLLERIVLDKNLRFILILGAYRDHKLDPLHPLAGWLSKIAAQNQEVVTLAMKPLAISHVQEMLQESLHCGAEQVKEPAKVCMAETKGNPFFLTQFLYSLQEDKLLYFNRRKKQWVWNLAGFKMKEVTNNIIDLMIKRISKLPQATIELLQYAACMKNYFDLHSLAIVSQMPVEKTAENLKAALETGLLVLRGDQYVFPHDRIQQAAYSLLKKPLRNSTHYLIGRRLYQNLPKQEKEARLLEITDHFNKACTFFAGQDERLFLLDLNLRAGKKAKLLSDYSRAAEYYTHARNLLVQDSWEKAYEQTLELHLEAAEAALACADYDLMERLAAETLANSKGVLDRAKIYEILIQAYTAQNKLEKALEKSRDILKQLGISFPQHPHRGHVILEYLKIRKALQGKKTTDLLNLPLMSDAGAITAMRIIVSIGIASYTASPYIFFLLILKGMSLSLQKGITEGTTATLAGYGCMLTILNKPGLGKEFFLLALEIQKKQGFHQYDSLIQILFNMLAWHWKDPQALKKFPEAYQSAVKAGNLLTAGHSLMQYFVYSYLLGKELPLIKDDAAQYYHNLLKTSHDTAIRVSSLYLQIANTFLGDTPAETQSLEATGHEDTLLPQYLKSNDRTVVFTIYFQKLLLNYYFGNYREALFHLEQAEKYLDGVQGTICVPITHFYRTLILAVNYEKMSGLQKLQARRKIARSLKLLEKLSALAPQLFLNKFCLMQAELARINHNYFQAEKFYDQAIELAGINRLIPEEALANELAGRFYLAAGRKTPARMYLNNASFCYQKWGAKAKVTALPEQYAGIFQTTVLYQAEMGQTLPPPELTPSLSNLDLYTIIKMSQALSQELVLEDLLKFLISGMLQYSGARRVIFIMNYPQGLTIEAEGNAENSSIDVMQALPLEKCIHLPRKLISYVARTGKPLMLDAQQANLPLLQDEYLIRCRPKSLFCQPLAVKGKIIGVCYLENDLIEDVFQGNILPLLQLLSSQIAISLDNANMYRNLETTIESHTQELKNKNRELREVNQRLTIANETKTRFVANVSHELRTPLQGIMGMAELMQRAGQYNDQYLTMIKSSADVLLGIINDILDISKMECNRLEIQEQSFNLELLLQPIIHNFKYQAAEKHLEFYYSPDPEIPRYLLGDPLRIRQIINNLLSNALKFTSQGSIELTVFFERVNDLIITLILQIRDSGIGIPRNKQETIFENFTQLDSLNYGGTGLGLAIVKRLVELMKGRITVESGEGQGSTFTCFLPLKVASQSEAAAATDLSSPQFEEEDLQGLNIIAAEDNEVNRIYLKNLLEHCNCRVTLVSNGQELLDLLAKNHFDCILMDKNMPELDGIEATRIIRQAEAGSGRHTPIVAITASAMPGEQENLAKEGMDYYLTKPIRENDLLNILRQIRLQKPAEPKPKYRYIDSTIFLDEAHLFGEKVMLDMIDAFFQDYPALREEVESDLKARDCSRLEKSVHRLASAISGFYAQTPYDLARSVEQKARGKDIEKAQAKFAELSRAMELFLIELHDMKKHLLLAKE